MKVDRMAAVAALFTATAVQANPKAIWEIYPILECKYDRMQFCQKDMSSCSPDQGQAVLTFNFARSEIRSFGTKAARPIIGRFHCDSPYGDTNAVMSQGNLYTFFQPTKAEMNMEKDTVDGVSQGATTTEAYTAHMTCHPQ